MYTKVEANLEGTSAGEGICSEHIIHVCENVLVEGDQTQQ